MKIVNKYIFRQALVGFLTILISLTVLIWLTQSLRMIDMIVTKGASVGIFLKMTLLVLPNFMQILTPLAVFGVALFVFIRMQADKELIVLKAVGMSSRELMRPLLTLGIFLVVFGYALTLWIIPNSYTELRQTRWKVQNDLSHLLLQEGQFNSFKNGSTLYIKERGNAGKVKGILAYEIKADKRTILIAEEGNIIQTPEGISLTFVNGTRQEFQPQTHEFSTLKFDKYTMLLSDATGKSSRKLDHREMPLKKLLTTKSTDMTDQLAYRKYKVEAFKRLTQPLYTLLFLWLAAFGVLSGFYNRRGQSRQINVVIVAALLIQSFALAFENIAARNLWGLLLMGANLFIPLILLYFVLFKERKIGWFHMVLAFVLCSQPLTAQAIPKVNVENINKKDPISFEADHMDYNIKTNILTASGNVVLQQNQLQIQTEKIMYDKENDTVSIPDSTRITFPDGTKSVVEQMVLHPKASEANATTLSGEFTDGSHMKAEKITATQNGNLIIMENASYTPCDMCQDKSPLWQVEAKKITQDFNDHVISYKHMLLDVKDIPILYFPYFQMPDMTIKRKTGFLIPTIRHNHEMGFSIETPFFINLTDNQNLLFTPIISANHMPLGILDYDARFTKGVVSVQLSGTQDKDSKNEGHIKGVFEYDMTPDIRLSGQYFRTISDTYFRRYDIPNINDSDSFLTSHLTGEYFGTRFYSKAKMWHFQSLMNDVSSTSIPLVIPTLDMQYTTLPLFNTNIQAFTNLNGAMYNTREHFKSNRLSLTQGFKQAYTTPFGLLMQNNVSIRLDGYALDTGNEGLYSKHANDSYNKGRFFPVASTKLSYPLVAQTKNSTQILEPIAMLIAAPNTKNSQDIPNIDSTVFDFDDTNLFSENRFAGYDRIETGSRINYGLRWTAYHNGAQNRTLSILFGQTYRLHQSEELRDVMGYHHHLSDYVGNVRLSYEYLQLYYRFRLNRENFSKRKNDVGLAIGSNPFRLHVNYLFQNAYTLDNKLYDEENEIQFGVGSQLTKNWQTSAYYRYNLKKDGGPIEYGAQLRYDNECTSVVFSLNKSFARDRNYKGSTSLMIKIFLKTLGGIGQ